MDEQSVRKTTRLYTVNYNDPKAYFLTLCTSDRKPILSMIESAGEYAAPNVVLTDIGKIVDNNIKKIGNFYAELRVDSYVIMPNHVHLILIVDASHIHEQTSPQNTVVARFLSTLKRFCNKEIGKNIWQYRSFDHIIRSKSDLVEHRRYISDNPLHWEYDKMYDKQKG